MRSGYSAQMKIFSDVPNETLVTWYVVDPEVNGVLPYATVFGSQVWNLSEKVSPPVGEQFYPRPYANGSAPPGINYPKIGLNPTALGFCGSKRQWEEGCLTSDIIPPTWVDSSVPVCCPRPAFQFSGGTATGKNWVLLCGFDPNAFPNVCFVYFDPLVSAGVCNVLNFRTIPAYFGESAPWVQTGQYALYASDIFLINGKNCQIAITCFPGVSPPPGSIVVWDVDDNLLVATGGWTCSELPITCSPVLSTGGALFCSPFVPSWMVSVTT